MNRKRVFKKDFVPCPVTDIPVPRHHQLDLEIGAGDGRHAMIWTKKNPERHLVAIEKTKNKFFKFSKSLEEDPRHNLTALHDHAVHWCSHRVQGPLFEHIFILYPNPEPNNPNQRWLRMPFFEHLLLSLKPHGKVILRSNIKSYMDESYEWGTEHWGLKVVRFEKLLQGGQYLTSFEEKYLNRGEPCWELVLQKQ